MSLTARPFRPPAARRLIPILFPRPFSTTVARAKRKPQPLPYTHECPPNECSCGPAPPRDLDIERKSPLMNTMAAYKQHVIVRTGKDDWTSRIEDEEGDAGAFVRGLKGVSGKGGKAFDPFNNILISTSSYDSDAAPKTTTALLFPAFLKFQNLPTDPASLAAFHSAYLKPTSLHPLHPLASAPHEQKAHLLRDESQASLIPKPEPIKDPIVFICGHGGRDKRCGIIGPLLREQFAREFFRRCLDGDVELISHIGGHKFAGNVIIYMPPKVQRPMSTWALRRQQREAAEAEEEGEEGIDLDEEEDVTRLSAQVEPAQESTQDTQQQPGKRKFKSFPTTGQLKAKLDGAGIWYGRVGPTQVEGIMGETVANRKIVGELFRGGITHQGESLVPLVETWMQIDRKRFNKEEAVRIEKLEREQAEWDAKMESRRRRYNLEWWDDGRAMEFGESGRVKDSDRYMGEQADADEDVEVRVLQLNDANMSNDEVDAAIDEWVRAQKEDIDKQSGEDVEDEPLEVEPKRPREAKGEVEDLSFELEMEAERSQREKRKMDNTDKEIRDILAELERSGEIKKEFKDAPVGVDFAGIDKPEFREWKGRAKPRR